MRKTIFLAPAAGLAAAAAVGAVVAAAAGLVGSAAAGFGASVGLAAAAGVLVGAAAAVGGFGSAGFGAGDGVVAPPQAARTGRPAERPASASIRRRDNWRIGIVFCPPSLPAYPHRQPPIIAPID